MARPPGPERDRAVRRVVVARARHGTAAGHPGPRGPDARSRARSCAARSTSSPAASTGSTRSPSGDPLRDWFLRFRPAAEREGTEAAQEAHAGRAPGGARRRPSDRQGARRAGHGVRRQRRPVGEPGPRVPRRTWERRRADRLALAEAWVGPEDAGDIEGRPTWCASYLRPSARRRGRTSPSGAGVGVADLQAAAASAWSSSPTRTRPASRSSTCPALPLPDPDTPAPVRFLPHWDALTLAHARRSGILPEAHRAILYHIEEPGLDGHRACRWPDRRRVALPRRGRGAGVLRGPRTRATGMRSRPSGWHSRGSPPSPQPTGSIGACRSRSSGLPGAARPPSSTR